MTWPNLKHPIKSRSTIKAGSDVATREASDWRLNRDRQSSLKAGAQFAVRGAILFVGESFLK